MSTKAVLLPLLVQVALTFGLGFWMAALRVRAIRSHRVRPSDVALREPGWPKRVLQVQYAFHNQLELPILFYLVTVLALLTRTADQPFVILAWIYVALRLVHAWIHVTQNNMRRRGVVFITGAVVLCVMWVVFAIRLLAAA
jgi:hypothetical protein